MKKQNTKFYFGLLFFIMLFSNLFAQTKTFTLKDCIQYGWENSTEISRANNTIASNKSSFEQSKAALLPNLNLNINQNFSSSKTFETNSKDWIKENNSTTNFGLNSSMTLYNGAKLLNSIKQKRSELSASELDIQTTKELLSLEILTAYINVLLAEEQLENSKNQLTTTTKQVEFVEAKKQSGIASNSDYLNVKSQLASDKAALISAQSQLRINYVSLMQTMNMPMQESLNIVTPEIEHLLKNKIELSSDEIYNTALNTKAEIESANIDLENSKINIKIAKADYLPSLILNGNLETNYNDNLSEVNFSDQLENQLKSAIGISLSVPIFQRKQTQNQVTQAKISAKNSELNFIDIKSNLRKNIEQAYTETKVAEMQFEAANDQLEAERESYLLAEEMFTQGLINSVDYFSSKDNYMNAESNKTQAKFTLILKNKVIDYYLGNPITL